MDFSKYVTTGVSAEETVKIENIKQALMIL